MNKEIHYYFNADYPDATLTNFVETGIELDLCNENGCGVIHTTQSHFISTQRFREGYKIFAHFNSADFVEVMLGDGNKNTKRNIKMTHNLEKLLLSDEFI